MEIDAPEYETDDDSEENDDDDFEGDSDLGAEFGLDDAFGNDDDDFEGQSDIVDDAIMRLIDEVAEEYEEESAVQAVYDAIEELISENAIADMPEDDATEDDKIRWIQNSIPRIRAKLQSFGIELEAGAETFGGAKY